MRKTLIDTANVCMARHNATGDELFAHIAASFVVLGEITYDELDDRVWSRDAYCLAMRGKRSDYWAEQGQAKE
jgi:hypothetical protein